MPCSARRNVDPSITRRDFLMFGNVLMKNSVFPLRIFPALHWMINLVNETVFGGFLSSFNDLLIFDKAYLQLVEKLQRKVKQYIYPVLFVGTCLQYLYCSTSIFWIFLSQEHLWEHLFQLSCLQHSSVPRLDAHFDINKYPVPKNRILNV